MESGNQALPSINLVGHAPLVKMLITLELHGILSSFFTCLYIIHCLDLGIQNKDEASPSISADYHGYFIKNVHFS